MHDVSVQGSAQLNAEIRKVLEIGLNMSREANNLTSALKGRFPAAREPGGSATAPHTGDEWPD